MLRITTEKNDGRTRFRLEGKLKGEWVGELERCWIYTRNARPEMEFSIDLSNVDFVDESGNALLTHMASQGARLEARSNLMMSSLVQDIVHSPTAQGK